jgi:hypothetical protein
MARIRRTYTLYVAKTKSGSIEEQVINQDQDVHVCGWMMI